MNRGELAELVRRAMADLDVRVRVREAVEGLRGPVRLVAIGKAAPAMAEGAMGATPITRAIVVTNDGTDASAAFRAARRAHVALEVRHASHPLPDRRSVAAADACLALAAARDEGTLLVLVSGGASSLVCAPAPGVSLARKRAVARAMLRSGADVRAINVVRKHLSRIKGGALARAALPDRVVTLVASDVVGGLASDVGSGPSLPDPSTVAESRRLLARHAPAHASLPLVATLSARSALARGIAAPRVIASPEELARRVAAHLRASGLRVRVLPPSTDDVDTLAAVYVRLARTAPPGTAFVRAAEPAVVVPRRAGRGGRGAHLAALVGSALERDALFGAFATDGVDGSSGTAGAVVDAGFTARSTPRALERALARFDTGPLHVAAGTALPSRPTGQNLADLHVLVVR